MNKYTGDPRDIDAIKEYHEKQETENMPKRDILIRDFNSLVTAGEYDSKLCEILNDPKYRNQSLHKLSESQIDEIFEECYGDEIKSMSQ